MISLMSSMPVCEAASISMTSTWRDSMIAWQCTPSSGMSTLGRSILPGRLIIEGARQDARRRRLADAAHAGQDIGLVDAAGWRRNWRACAPSAPGRSGPRSASGDICAPARDRASLRRAHVRSADAGAVSPARVLLSCARHHSSGEGRNSACWRRKAEAGSSRRLDKDPPWLVRAASFRT